MEDYIAGYLAHNKLVRIKFYSESICDTLIRDGINGLHTFEIISKLNEMSDIDYPIYLLHAMSDNYKEYLLEVGIDAINYDVDIIEDNLTNLYTQSNVKNIIIIRMERIINYKLEHISRSGVLYYSSLNLYDTNLPRDGKTQIADKCKYKLQSGSTIRKLFANIYVRNERFNMNTRWVKHGDEFHVDMCSIYRTDSECSVFRSKFDDDINIIISNNGALHKKILQKITNQEKINEIIGKKNLKMTIRIGYVCEGGKICIGHIFVEIDRNGFYVDDEHVDSFAAFIMEQLFYSVKKSEKTEFLCTMVELFRGKQLDSFMKNEYDIIDLFRELNSICIAIDIIRKKYNANLSPKREVDKISLIMFGIIEEYISLEIRERYRHKYIPFEIMANEINNFDKELNLLYS